MGGVVTAGRDRVSPGGVELGGGFGKYGAVELDYIRITLSNDEKWVEINSEAQRSGLNQVKFVV